MLQRPVPLGRRLSVRVDAKKPTVHAKVADKNRKGGSAIKLNQERLYTDKEYKPSPQLGSIALHKGAGYRPGIVTTSTIGLSDVVLVSEPVAHMTAALGTTLRPVDLVGAMQERQLSAADSFRLAALNHGNKDAARLLTSLEQLTDAQGHLSREAAKRDAARKGFGAAAATAAAQQEQKAAPITPAQLEAIVKLNALGHEHLDLAATACRGEEQAAFLGIWPELALINHSCTPNAVAVPIGDRMILRANKTLAKGTEITVSHLDELVFAPLQVRRKALQAVYGFKCQCSRCQMEESQPPAVQEQLQSIWERLTAGGGFLQLRARLAVVKRDKCELAALVQEVQPWMEALEAAMRDAEVPPPAQLCLKAGVYGAYEIIAVGRDAGEEMDPKHPAGLATMASIVAAGSESHLCLSVEQLVRAGQIAKESPDTQAAAHECILAHKIRYGVVPDALLTRLIEARSKVDSYMGRVNLDAPGSTGSTGRTQGATAPSAAEAAEMAVQAA